MKPKVPVQILFTFTRMPHADFGDHGFYSLHEVEAKQKEIDLKALKENRTPVAVSEVHLNQLEITLDLSDPLDVRVILESPRWKDLTSEKVVAQIENAQPYHEMDKESNYITEPDEEE